MSLRYRFLDCLMVEIFASVSTHLLELKWSSNAKLTIPRRGMKYHIQTAQ
jgi:hypothetical protein